MLILMYLLDRIIMILILKIMTFGDGDSNDNIDKKIYQRNQNYCLWRQCVYWLSTELETADSGTNQQEFNDGCPTQDTKTNQTQNMAKTRDQNLDVSTMF